MRALLFEQHGEPREVLAIHQLSDPVPGAGEVLVRILLSPIHPADLHTVRGRFGRQPSLPASPGVECVGVIEALGAGVKSPTVGTRVVLINVRGVWRDRVVCSCERVVPVPNNVSDEVAAQAIINPLTAWALTKVEHRLQPGDWLVQSAAGSTVGRLILQLARSEGFHTINLVRRQAQVAEINSLGGDMTICTDDEDWPAKLSKVVGELGVSKAVDCVAGDVGASIASSLNPGGRMLVYGALSSHRQKDPSAFTLPIFAPRLIYSAVAVQGWFLFHWFDVTPLDACRSAIEAVLSHLASGDLRLPRFERHALAHLPAALNDADAASRDAKPLLDFTQD